MPSSLLEVSSIKRFSHSGPLPIRSPRDPQRGVKGVKRDVKGMHFPLISCRFRPQFIVFYKEMDRFRRQYERLSARRGTQDDAIMPFPSDDGPPGLHPEEGHDPAAANDQFV